MQAGDWATVSTIARKMVKREKKNPEGFFLTGLAEKALQKTDKAEAAFRKAISLDARRYDVAIELANQYLVLQRQDEAVNLLNRYTPLLENSPVYLDMAATTYTRLGLPARAWPLYQKACKLQPGIGQFQANHADCAVLLGKIEEAKIIYQGLIAQNPNYQKNHYQLSRLKRAKDATHVVQMQTILKTTKLPADRNIFMYYAIGKELEDLERWQEAFHYYKLAGDAVTGVGDYDVETDIALMDRIIEVCNSDWLAAGNIESESQKPKKSPIFIVGLPRSGTTLTERIVSSHSLVESADETFFMQLQIQRLSGIHSKENMSPAVIGAAAKKDIKLIARGYLAAVEYRLSDKLIFIDKLPDNFLYLGFIAKAYPHAHIIHLRRNPMDSCFAMYKQSFFKFAYNLESLGRYYEAYDRLRRHWEDVLKDRVIEVKYESLVTDHESQIRGLLDKLGLDFEQACLDFEQNEAPSATASAVQVREKAHTRSVGKWKRFATELQPLKDHLVAAGIRVD